MLNSCVRVFFLLLCAVVLPAVQAASYEEELEKQSWKEVDVALPAAPDKQSLLPFYVSAATDNQFFIDRASLSVGNDGVVRYTLVIETSGGARNVSYEGMRCETRERRIYASGRSDGSWSSARRKEWVPVREAVANRHYAALYLDVFCPSGIIVNDVETIVRTLRTGGRTGW